MLRGWVLCSGVGHCGLWVCTPVESPRWMVANHGRAKEAVCCVARSSWAHLRRCCTTASTHIPFGKRLFLP